MQLDKACENWHLNKQQAAEIFRLIEKTTFMEIDLSDVSIEKYDI